jgi:hypothetical protein
MNKVLAVLIFAGTLHAQSGFRFYEHPEKAPDIVPLYDASDTTATGHLYLMGESRQAFIEMPLSGDKMLIGYNKEGDVILTVYRDGRVDAKNKAAITEESKFFWTEFAKYYREQMILTGCSEMGTQK